VVCACTTPSADAPADSALDTVDDTDTGTDSDSGIPSLPTYDCAGIPAQIGAIRQVANAAGFHGLAFNDQDQIIGADGDANLLAIASDGTGGVWIPNAGWTEQLAFLPDGDLAVASAGAIHRRTPEGGVSEINGLNVYGLVVGPDGMIYTAASGNIERVEPVSGARTELVSQYNARVVAFNHVGSQLVFGTVSRSGEVFTVELDANFDPVDDPVLIGTTPGDWHDGIGVDVCGNAYVVEYETRSLYRIGVTTGEVVQLHWFQDTTFAHGLIWGPGSGGWDDRSLYLPQPFNDRAVMEMELGVPSAGWAGEPVNASPF